MKNRKPYLNSLLVIALVIELDRKSSKQKIFIESEEYGYRSGLGALVDNTNDILYAAGNC